jgi:hypothetical protein
LGDLSDGAEVVGVVSLIPRFFEFEADVSKELALILSGPCV